jgi:hypothetical protein
MMETLIVYQMQALQRKIQFFKHELQICKELHEKVNSVETLPKTSLPPSLETPQLETVLPKIESLDNVSKQKIRDITAEPLLSTLKHLDDVLQAYKPRGFAPAYLPNNPVIPIESPEHVKPCFGCSGKNELQAAFEPVTLPEIDLRAALASSCLGAAEVGKEDPRVPQVPASCGFAPDCLPNEPEHVKRLSTSGRKSREERLNLQAALKPSTPDEPSIIPREENKLKLQAAFEPSTPSCLNKDEMDKYPRVPEVFESGNGGFVHLPNKPGIPLESPECLEPRVSHGDISSGKNELKAAFEPFTPGRVAFDELDKYHRQRDPLAFDSGRWIRAKRNSA